MTAFIETHYAACLIGAIVAGIVIAILLVAALVRFAQGKKDD